MYIFPGKTQQETMNCPAASGQNIKNNKLKNAFAASYGKFTRFNTNSDSQIERGNEEEPK